MAERLVIYRFVKPFFVSQMFGETKIDYTKYGIPSHNGLDVPTTDWQPVYSGHDGIVSEVFTDKAAGNGVRIKTTEKYAWEKGEHFFKLGYWHLAASNVKVGEKVGVGQLIGWADSTGNVTGSHVHFELKALNDDGSVFEHSNGWYGAQNCWPYMATQDAFELNSTIKKIQLQLADLLSRLQDWLSKRG